MHAHEIRAHLLARDPRLAPVFAAVPPAGDPEPGDLAETLMRAVVGQQLSVAAASTIWGRVEKACGAPLRPAAVLTQSDETLRACGLSRQKASYLRAVADFALAHDLRHEALRDLTDDGVIRLLTQIRGVGRWTVEMLLIFELGRPDVLPLDDLGIQNAMRRLYGMRGQGKAFLRRMEFYAKPWRPHRSHVVRCLWRWLDGVPM